MKYAMAKSLLVSFIAEQPINCDDWYIDSGASSHMTMRKELLIDVSNEPVVAAHDHTKKPNSDFGHKSETVDQDNHLTKTSPYSPIFLLYKIHEYYQFSLLLIQQKSPASGIG